MPQPRVALVLGGGGARALAHVGALEVLEREGLRPDFLVGTSMGGLLAALCAAGLDAAEIHELARGFGFPRWFIPGSLVRWDRLFAPAARRLAGLTFEALPRPLAVVAVDIEGGRQVVLHSGGLLPALQATCAVPGVLPPVAIDGRWLVDGALTSLLPVDVASMGEPDVVVAVRAGARRQRRMASLRGPWAGFAARLGGIVPNPLTARCGFEVLVRATEIALDRQGALASSMVEPDVLVDAQVGDVGLRDFHLLEQAVAAGRRATEAALPALQRALRRLPRSAGPVRPLELHVDPVCDMVVSPGLAAAALDLHGRTHYFCSLGCRDTFLRRAGGGGPR